MTHQLTNQVHSEREFSPNEFRVCASAQSCNIFPRPLSNQVYPHILDQLNREKEKESLLMTHVHELGQQLYRFAREAALGK